MMTTTTQGIDAPAIISITRGASCLTAHVLMASRLNLERNDLPEAMAKADYSDVCGLEAYPLECCPVPLSSAQKRLAQAWRMLESVRTANADVLFHVLIVLMETVDAGAETNDTSVLPPLAFAAQEETVKYHATAAHPRAYRGTKYRPPKSKAPETLDLRPYLRDTQGLTSILTCLHRFWGEVMPRLRQAGYEVSMLRAPEGQLVGICDVYAAVHHGAAARGYTSHLPERFRAESWPLLRGLTWDEVRRHVALYGKLQLETNTPLRNAWMRVTQLQNDARTLQWGEILTELPAEGRVTFCVMLAETGAHRNDPAALNQNIKEWLRNFAEQPYASYRLYCLLRALTVGVDADYLLTGFMLADRYESPSERFHEVVQSGPCDIETVQRIAARISSLGKWEHYRLLRVWEGCGELAGFGAVMAAITWEAYSPDVANRYLGIFISILWQDWTDAQKARCWKFVRQSIRAMETLLRETAPEYQAKCVAMLGECVWEWGERWDAPALFIYACSLIRRLCHPPFHRHLPEPRIIALLSQYLDTEQHTALMASPDSSFLRLEEACARRNKATLVEAGYWALLRTAPEWTAACFAHYPAKLCKVAALLGCFSDGLRDQVTRSFQKMHAAQEQASDSDWRDMSLTEAVAWMEAKFVFGCTNPVPRPIREQLAGGKNLNAPRLAHYRAEMEKGLYLMQLEQLESAALVVLGQGYEADAQDALVMHALQMRCHITDNRRAFSKFLRAYFGGDKDYIFAHPLSQAWLRRHPELRLETWLRGIEFKRGLPEGGSVQISVEQDPLEALKLGTVVGSCLGLGGRFAYSAIAAALDINKQVLYTRDEKGTVLARQLAAISEAGQLVCFEIYPIETSAAIQRLFRQYNMLWADALGLTLYCSAPDTDYYISNVLSTYWWDDHAWDFQIDEVDE